MGETTPRRGLLELALQHGLQRYAGELGLGADFVLDDLLDKVQPLAIMAEKLRRTEYERHAVARIGFGCYCDSLDRLREALAAVRLGGDWATPASDAYLMGTQAFAMFAALDQIRAKGARQTAAAAGKRRAIGEKTDAQIQQAVQALPAGLSKEAKADAIAEKMCKSRDTVRRRLIKTPR